MNLFRFIMGKLQGRLPAKEEALLSEAEQAKFQAEKLIQSIKRGNQDGIREDADHLYERAKGICEKVFGKNVVKCPNCGAEVTIWVSPRSNANCGAEVTMTRKKC
jgi:hypothetical protein